jgi:hypothetical protein
VKIEMKTHVLLWLAPVEGMSRPMLKFGSGVP